MLEKTEKLVGKQREQIKFWPYIIGHNCTTLTLKQNFQLCVVPKFLIQPMHMKWQEWLCINDELNGNQCTALCNNYTTINGKYKSSTHKLSNKVHLLNKVHIILLL